MGIPILAPGLPFPAAAFPYTATIAAETWPADADGAPSETDGTGVSVACDKQPVNQSGKGSERSMPDGVPRGETCHNFLFLGKPAAAIGVESRIYVTSGPGGAYSPAECWSALDGLTDRGDGLWGVTALRVS